MLRKRKASAIKSSNSWRPKSAVGRYHSCLRFQLACTECLEWSNVSRYTGWETVQIPNSSLPALCVSYSDICTCPFCIRWVGVWNLAAEDLLPETKVSQATVLMNPAFWVTHATHRHEPWWLVDILVRCQWLDILSAEALKEPSFRHSCNICWWVNACWTDTRWWNALSLVWTGNLIHLHDARNREFSLQSRLLSDASALQLYPNWASCHDGGWADTAWLARIFCSF